MNIVLVCFFLSSQNAVFGQEVRGTDISTEEKIEVLERNIDELAGVLKVLDDYVRNTLKRGDDGITEKRVDTLEEHSKMADMLHTKRTCQEYSSYGFTTSGEYNIDPDGAFAGHPPFRVYCDFETSTTEVMHDKETKIKIENCPEEMCFHLDVNYTGTTEQIIALMELSDTCHQRITFDCFSAPFSHNGVTIGALRDREERHFAHVCDCKIANNCTEEEMCNCDAYIVPQLQQDLATVRNTSILPIKGFDYGNLKYSMQTAAITIGRMKCQGKKQIDGDEVSASCKNLKLHGIKQSGYQILNNQSIAFCEMQESNNIQRDVGKFLLADQLNAEIGILKNSFEGEIAMMKKAFDKKHIELENRIGELEEENTGLKQTLEATKSEMNTLKQGLGELDTMR